MSVPKKLGVTPRCCLSLQVDPERAQQINDLAFELGVTRHKLMGMAFNAGLPIVVAQHGHQSRPAARLPAAKIPPVNLPKA